MSKIIYKFSEDIKQLFLNKFASIWHVYNIDIIFRFFISRNRKWFKSNLYLWTTQKSILFRCPTNTKYCDWLRLGYFQNNIFLTQSFQFKSVFFSYRKQKVRLFWQRHKIISFLIWRSFGDVHFITTQIHWICSTIESIHIHRHNHKWANLKISYKNWHGFLSLI